MKYTYLKQKPPLLFLYSLSSNLIHCSQSPLPSFHAISFSFLFQSQIESCFIKKLFIFRIAHFIKHFDSAVSILHCNYFCTDKGLYGFWLVSGCSFVCVFFSILYFSSQTLLVFFAYFLRLAYRLFKSWNKKSTNNKQTNMYYTYTFVVYVKIAKIHAYVHVHRSR